MSHQLGEAIAVTALEPSDEQRVEMSDDWGTQGGDRFLSTPKVVDYKVVEATDALQLQSQVAGLIREGYEPQGGINVTMATIDSGAPRVTREVWHYAQAMVLYGLVD
jgi:hypothetical protein